MFLNYLERLFIDPETGAMSVMGYLTTFQLLFASAILIYGIRFLRVRYGARKERPSYACMVWILADTFKRTLRIHGETQIPQKYYCIQEAVGSGLFLSADAFRIPSVFNTTMLPKVIRRVLRHRIGMVARRHTESLSGAARHSEEANEVVSVRDKIVCSANSVVEQAFAMAHDYNLSFSPADMCELIAAAICASLPASPYEESPSLWWTEDYAKDPEVFSSFRLPKLVEAEKEWNTYGGTLTLLWSFVTVCDLVYVFSL